MKEAIAVAFVVIVLAVGATVATSSIYNTPTTVQPYSAIPTASSQFNPITNLRFTMSLNSSTVERGGILAVSLNLFNTLDRVNNVTGAGNWRLTNESENSGTVGWNCAQNDIFRIEVVSGYYDLNNFTKGTPLDVFIWQPPFAFNQCLYYIRAANNTAEPLSVPWQGQNNYAFNPISNVAQWTTAQDWSVRCGPANTTISYPCPQIGQKAVMNETMTLKPALFTNSTGVFTVICGDEWGDLEVAHFYVEASTSNTGQVSTQTDTFFTVCSITGTGTLSLRIVSDSTGVPVEGAKVSAVLQTGCDIVGSGSETQTVYVNNFTQGQGGWLTPVLPSQAQEGGIFHFTVVYQGETYNFSADISPVSVTCVTLHVPSGNVNSPSYFASNLDCASQ